MIDILILRNDVLAILGEILGTYTFPNNGGITQAIACLPDPAHGWNYPENGTKTSGLEVVIKQPYPDVSANIGGDRTCHFDWVIHLKQWDTNQSLIDVINKLGTELPAQYFIERISPMPISDKLLTIEQCKIFITDWVVTAP